MIGFKIALRCLRWRLPHTRIIEIAGVAFWAALAADLASHLFIGA